jgi:hypothetical protein
MSASISAGAAPAFSPALRTTADRMVAVWGRAAGTVAAYKARSAEAEGDEAAARRWAEVGTVLRGGPA